MDISPDLRTWLGLSQDERSRLVAHFTVRKSTASAVMNNTIVSDGHTVEDLKRLSIGNLIKFLGEDLPWYKEAQLDNLLSLTIDKIYGRTKKPEAEEPKSEGEEGKKTKPKGTGETKAKKTPFPGTA